MPKKFKVNIYRKQYLQAIASRAQKVLAIYDDAIRRASQIATATPYDGEGSFFFKNYPKAKTEIDLLMQQLAYSLQVNIENGNEELWKLANTKNDAMVEYLVENTSIPADKIAEWSHPNLEALQAFNNRKIDGMKLSTRVWNLTQPFKQELELAMEVGIGEGKSADELSRDVRRILNEPNKLFRRVRDKSGQLRLSKAAKAYNPGMGVYRSSYKNALRMTATENNIAYRTSDHERWNQLDFVLGIEIKLSNNHPEPDICDDLAGRYPKGFKFTGWHPWCRCQATAILPTQAEMVAYGKAIMDGTDEGWKFNGVVDDTPKVFSKWVSDNHNRIAEARKMPYFLKDNPSYLEKAGYKIPESQKKLFSKMPKKSA